MRNEHAFSDAVARAFKKVPRARTRKLPADGYGGEGTPDRAYVVDGVQGYLELKYVPFWPVRETTTVLVELTPRQFNWMADWIACGGRAHVLVGVSDEWFLMDLPSGPMPRYDRLAFQALRAQGHAGKMRELRRLPALLHSLPQVGDS